MFNYIRSLYHSSRANKLFLANQLHNAKDEINKAIALDPASVGSILLLACIEMKLGEYANAFEHSQAVIINLWNESAWYDWMKQEANNIAGYCLFMQKNYRQAFNYFSVSLLHGVHTGALFYKAMSAFYLGDFQMANVAFEQYKKCDKPSPKVYLYDAYVKIQLHDYHKALNNLFQILVLPELDAAIKLEAGLLLLKMYQENTQIPQQKLYLDTYIHVLEKEESDYKNLIILALAEYRIAHDTSKAKDYCLRIFMNQNAFQEIAPYLQKEIQTLLWDIMQVDLAEHRLTEAAHWLDCFNRIEKNDKGSCLAMIIKGVQTNKSSLFNYAKILYPDYAEDMLKYVFTSRRGKSLPDIKTVLAHHVFKRQIPRAKSENDLVRSTQNRPA